MAEAKKKFSIDDIEERSIIVPNPEMKGNFAHCVDITFGKIGNEKEEGEEDNRQLGITFKFIEEETGAVLNYVCFEPKLEDEDDKDKVRLYTNNWSRIKQMFGSYIKDAEGKLGLDDLSFEEVYKKYMSVIDPQYSKVRTKLKVVYNKKNNVTLGLIGNVISTQYRKRAFEWNPKYDFVIMKGKAADDFGGDAGDDDDL